MPWRVRPVRGSRRSPPPRRPSSPPCCPTARAYAIRAEFGQTARDQLTCGCHVHVSIADEDEGVRILDHLRPWNAVLLALSGNSPSWLGTTTGYASYRSQVWGRWPTAGPTAPFGDAAGYRAVIDDLLRTQTILDDGMVYFDARLSSRYPTVEVRVADVCLDADDAALQAALVRGIAETATGDPVSQPRTELLRAATWRAARSGPHGRPGQSPDRHAAARRRRRRAAGRARAARPRRSR